MSRVRQELSVVQFQVQARQANASMDALRAKAEELKKEITGTESSIRALGNVSPSDAGLVAFQKTLRQLKSDLNDVTRAQNELTKGVLAADKLWKAALTGTMESLSIKEIKAGQRGMQVRMQNLQPGKENESMLRAMKAAIEEGDIAIRKFEADTTHLLETINQGGAVSNSVLAKAKNDLLGLLDVLPRGTEEWNAYNAQLQSVTKYIGSLSETERRLAGEVVTVADAMKMASLTSREMAEAEAAEAKADMEWHSQRRSGLEGLIQIQEGYISSASKELEVVDAELSKQRELKGTLEEAAEINKQLTQAKDERAKAARDEYAEMDKLLDLQKEQNRAESEYNNLKEKLGKTSNLKEQLKIREDIKKSEEKLLQVMIKVEEQEGLLEKARDVSREKIRNVSKAEEELTKAMGGRDYDKELEKLNDLEDKHIDLTDKLKEETEVYTRYTADAKEHADLETQAAVKMAQAQSYSQKTLEDSIAILERQNKIETDPEKYKQQADAVDNLRSRLKELSGEWMSLADAQKLAGEAGTEKFIASPEQLQKATAAIERRKKQLQETIQLQRRSGAATDAEEEELKKLGIQLKKLEMEQDNFNMSHSRMNALLKQPTSAKNLDELCAAIKRARAELNTMEDSLGMNNKQYQTMAAKVKKAEIQLKQMEAQSKGTASAFQKAWSRLKTYIGLYVGASVAMQKITKTMADLLELSDKMGEVRKTTGFSADEVGRLTSELKKLDTRSSINSLLELSVAAGQLGLKTQEDVQGFTEAANKLMVALPEMGREGATEMLKVALATGEIDKISRQMKEGVVEGSSATAVAMEKIGSTIDRLRATSAAAAPAITDFVKRVGAVGAQSGISIDQVAALGATVDALGMRVEMSATALSRMIPAIRNNAFELAKAIKVAPETIRNLFDTGRGMEAVLLILQHLKDQGLDEDGIEKLLGMGGMQDVMKDLNQMGARAGIVFAGLSQNVDLLRQQLATARDAYEENIAIQEEYDKMDKTTAAKWARLKNEVEEFIVSDQAQRSLGKIIEMLRSLVNLLTGNVQGALKAITVVLHTLIVSLATFRIGLGEGLLVKLPERMKELGGGLKNFVANTKAAMAATKELAVLKKKLAIAMKEVKLATDDATRALAKEKVATIEAEIAQKNLNKAKMANIWMALATAVVIAVAEIIKYIKASHEAAREAARFEAQLQKEQAAAEKLTNTVGKASVKVEEAQKKVDAARKALDDAKKSTDGSKESTERLAKAEADLVSAEEQLRTVQGEHARSIQAVNTQYGEYLGFMLSEKASADELAAARQLINDKLEETIRLKEKEAAIERVEEKMSGKRDKAYANLYDLVTKTAKSHKVVDSEGNQGVDPTAGARIMSRIATAAQQEYKYIEEFQGAVNKILLDEGYNGEDNEFYRASVISRAQVYYKELEKIRKKKEEVASEQDARVTTARLKTQKDLEQMYQMSVERYIELETAYASATGDARKQAAADLLKLQDDINEMVKNAGSYYKLEDKNEEKDYNTFIANSEARIKDMAKKRDQLLKAAGNAYASRTTIGGGRTTGNKENPWGDEPDAASTAYADWTVEQLVVRRKQMRDFRNALQTNTDVQTVLKEDSALRKAIEDGMSADMRTVIAWYNRERLEIQKELRSRWATNTGDWLDAGGSRRRGKEFDESTEVLAELERYYAWRKELIEDERMAENMSEAEYNRRLEVLEQEHLQKRSDLRTTFTHNETEEERAFTERFRQWWNSVEELYEVSWEKVDSEWAKATDRSIRYNNMNANKDLARMKGIVMKQMNEVADIISKERPFDGITRNLEDNLTKLSILFTDAERTDEQLFGADDFVRRRTERLRFLLSETEHIYGTGIEELMQRMREAGLGDWADAIDSDANADALRQALMAQLRSAYDAVQEAIKKEASLIKKQLEIAWNDAILPDGKGGTISQKHAFEATISALGLQEDQVKRANSLISAGQASERVADKLAIKQMQVRLAMQQQYFNMMRKIGDERIAQLKAAGELEDAEHLQKSLNLSLSEEQKKLDEQHVAIQNQLAESQNRLYTELREWGDLVAQSLQSVFEAANTGQADFWNEQAKKRLTGESTRGQYIVIENEGTAAARASYRTLSDQEVLDIEQRNAMADAWKKLMDDLNKKMSETITDQMNAMLQNASIDANTDATASNTQAILGLTAALNGAGNGAGAGVAAAGAGADRAVSAAGAASTEGSTEPSAVFLPGQSGGIGWVYEQDAAAAEAAAERKIASSEKVEEALRRQFHTQEQESKKTNEMMEVSTQSAFAKMTQAANLYGIAYQAMSNDNLSASQKFGMIAVQAAGQSAMAMLTTDLAAGQAKNSVQLPGILGKLLGEMPYPAAIATFALVTGLLGGLMGLAASQVTKSKSQIAQATGATANAGRLATGMLTYAEGNVNEFTDPDSLAEGRLYNVSAADGRTYRARYMGRHPRTHLTNGPEFHLSGERGREMIIDAGTTRQITMNEGEIWRAIQTLSSGGHLRRSPSVRRRGVAAFADGNVEDFAETGNGQWAGLGFDPATLQASLDRNIAIQEALLEQLSKPIHATFDIYGRGGLVDSYDTGKKTLDRYGQKH